MCSRALRFSVTGVTFLQRGRRFIAECHATTAAPRKGQRLVSSIEADSFLRLLDRFARELDRLLTMATFVFRRILK